MGELETHRACVACRNKDCNKLMLRFVLDKEDVLCFDLKGTAKARGAWLCAKKSCYEQAAATKSFSRSFKKAIKFDSPALYEHVLESLVKSVKLGLGLSFKSRSCVVGRTASVQSFEKEEVLALVLAVGMSDRFNNSLLDYKNESHFYFLTAEQLGVLVAKEKTGVVALLKKRINEHIVHGLQKLEGFKS